MQISIKQINYCRIYPDIYFYLYFTILSLFNNSQDQQNNNVIVIQTWYQLHYKT